MNDSQDVSMTQQEVSHGQPSLFSPEFNLIFLTWVTFFILLAVLYKFAWRPILTLLDQREENIRRSVEEAEKIRQEFLKIEETRKRILIEADTKAKDIVQQSRKSAINAAKVIDDKAKEEAQLLIENARTEIKAEFDRSRSILRRQSADLAVAFSQKLLKKELDEKRQSELLSELIKEV